MASANNQVTAAISSGSGTLGGTTTVTAVNGVATFTNFVSTQYGAGSGPGIYPTSWASYNARTQAFLKAQIPQVFPMTVTPRRAKRVSVPW